MAIFEGAPEWLEPVVKVGVAYLLSFPTAWFREKQGHAVGLRTFPIVAMSSCGFVLLAQGPPGPDTTAATSRVIRSEEHTSELQSQSNLVCRLLLEKKKIKNKKQKNIKKKKKKKKQKK